MNVIFRRDDIALVIGMFCILAVTVAVVVLKVKCTRNGIHMKPQEKTLTPNILYYTQINPNQFRQGTIFDRIRTVIWTSSSETKMTSETENLSKSIDPRLISFFQVNFIDPEPLNVSTFAPLPQAVSIFIIIGVMVQHTFWHFTSPGERRQEVCWLWLHPLQWPRSLSASSSISGKCKLNPDGR